MASYPLPNNKLDPHFTAVISGVDELGNTITPIIASLPENFSLSVQNDWQPLMPPGGLANALSNLGGGGLAKAAGLLAGIAKKGFGYEFMPPEYSQLLWNSSSPMELDVPFQFNATADAQSEVMENVKALIKLTLPSKVNTNEKIAAFANKYTATGSRLGDSLNNINSSITSATGVNVGNALNSLGSNLTGHSLGVGIPGINGSSLLKGPGPILFDNKYDIHLQLGKTLYFKRVIVLDVRADPETMFTRDGHFISVNVNVRFSTSIIVTKSDLDDIFSGVPNTNTPTATYSNSNIPNPSNVPSYTDQSPAPSSTGPTPTPAPISTSTNSNSGGKPPPLPNPITSTAPVIST